MAPQFFIGNSTSPASPSLFTMPRAEGNFEFQEFEAGVQHSDTEPLSNMSPDGHSLTEVDHVHVTQYHAPMQLRRSWARPTFDVILALVPIIFFGQ